MIYYFNIGNEMTQPSVEISPSVKEYYEGQIVELECKVAGNPTPTIRWQRGSNRPLPLNVVNRGSFLIIENPTVEDSGEYRQVINHLNFSHQFTNKIFEINVKLYSTFK